MSTCIACLMMPPAASAQAGGADEQTIRKMVADQSAGKQVIAYTDNRIHVTGPFPRPSYAKDDPMFRRVSDSLSVARKNVQSSQEIKRLEIAASGDMAYEMGEGRMAYDEPSGKRTEFTNSYVRIWRKINGQWLVDVFFARPNRPQ